MSSAHRWPFAGIAICLFLSPHFVTEQSRRRRLRLLLSARSREAPRISDLAEQLADLAIRLRNKNPTSKYDYELVSLMTSASRISACRLLRRPDLTRKVSAAVAHYCSAVGMATVGVFHKFGLPMTHVYGSRAGNHRWAEVRGNPSDYRQRDRSEPDWPQVHARLWVIGPGR